MHSPSSFAISSFLLFRITLSSLSSFLPSSMYGTRLIVVCSLSRVILLFRILVVRKIRKYLAIPARIPKYRTQYLRRVAVSHVSIWTAL